MAEEPEKKERYRLLAVVEGKTLSRSLDKDIEEDEVYTFPHFVYKELIAAVFVLAVLTLLSVLFNAPLDAEASSTHIPNPAKAPWYFVGLQELLVYFDPWIAGVTVPSLIVLGLMSIPYISAMREDHKYYNLVGYGKKAVFIGFFLWVILIIIGQFCRGPYWQWTWFGGAPIAAKPTVNLPNTLGIILLLAYFGAGFILPAIIGAIKKENILKKWGLIKYSMVALFSLFMFLVPLKMFLRLAFSVKYIVSTPWFNI